MRLMYGCEELRSIEWKANASCEHAYTFEEEFHLWNDFKIVISNFEIEN